MPDTSDFFEKNVQKMDRRKVSLMPLILVPVVSIILAGASLVLFLLERHMSKDLELAARDQAVLIANTIRNKVEIYDHLFQLGPLIESMAIEKNVVNISTMLPYTGEIITSSEADWRNMQVDELGASVLPRMVFDQFMANNFSTVGRLHEDSHTYTYAHQFNFRLDESGEILRPVLILLQLDTSEKAQVNRDQLQFYFLISLAAIVLMALFLYALFSYYIFTPINDVINVIDRRAEGDKKAKARVYRHDEIGLLALNLNIFIDTEEIIRGELTEKEEELQIIFDAVPLRIMCKDDKNNVLRMNKAAAEMLGTTVEEGEGKNITEFLPKDQAEQYFKDNLRVIESGVPEVDVVIRFRHPDGSNGWIKRHQMPYPSAMEGDRRILLVIEDITKLVESEKRFECVIEASKDGIRDWPDLSRSEQYWSPQFKSLLGYSDHELTANRETFLSIIHPDDLPATQRNLDQHINSGKPYEQEYRLKCKNGEYKWFLARSIVIKDDISGVTGLCGSITDIQGRKEAEYKLAEYMAELERSNNDLEQFTRVASHDLKAPLRGISQLVSWIAEDLESGDHTQVNQNIGMIQKRIKRLEQLLNDLLTFSKVGRGKEVCREIAVETMAKEIFDLSHPPKGFELKLEGELPVLDTLAAPFELIIRNLFSNAIKHHGGDIGTITFSGKEADIGNFYEFSVSDDGQGIDPKYHRVVFEMFSSLRPKDEVEGTGMGLSIVEKIVRTYGGEIYLESDVGQGTTIRFLWPRDLDAYNFDS